MLVAALIITGCSNNNSAQKNVKNQKEKEEWYNIARIFL